MTQAGSVRRVQMGELSAVEIRLGTAYAVILEQGAHLIRYGIEGERPVIWDNPNALFEKGIAVRGGIPVCWPWFGDIRWNAEPIQAMCSGADSPPFHGLVRNVDWQLKSTLVTDLDICVTFEYEASPDLSTCWPHHARLQLIFVIGQSLTLHMTTENLGANAIAVGQAMHTYYAVSNVERVRFTGFSGLNYFDVLDGWKIKSQDQEPTINQETTHAYINAPDTFLIEDREWNRQITVSTHGTRSAILWNPWKERALLLDQYQASSWKDMVCLETARLYDDLLMLRHGDADTMSLKITMQALT